MKGCRSLVMPISTSLLETGAIKLGVKKSSDVAWYSLDSVYLFPPQTQQRIQSIFSHLCHIITTFDSTQYVFQKQFYDFKTMSEKKQKLWEQSEPIRKIFYSSQVIYLSYQGFVIKGFEFIQETTCGWNSHTLPRVLALVCDQIMLFVTELK